MDEQQVVEHREQVLADLVLHLTKVSSEDLEKHTVQEIVEGFWMTLEAQALSETKPFELKGE